MTDWVFQPSILIVGSPEGEDREIVALKYIESISMSYDSSEENTVEKLKGDMHFIVRTISGREYRISMKTQYEIFDKYKLPEDPREMRQCIFEKWCHMMAQQSS